MQFRLNKNKAALLAVDLQSLFTSAEGPFENHAAGTTIDNVNKLLDECHCLNIPVIFSSYVLSDDLHDAGLLYDNPVVRKGLFSESSPWIGLDERLKLNENDIKLKRNRPSAFWGGELEKTLQSLEKNTILLCGLSVNNAISTTAREAFARDIPAIVIKECTGAAPWEKELDTYFEILDTWTAEVIGMKTLLNRLKQD